jgi:predicted Zn-dependent protease
VDADEERRAQQFDAAMRRAEEALAGGDAVRAAEIFEQASRIAGDSEVAETGMARAYMHNGEFRKALSYGNLSTLEHKDSTFGYAFLAYLVDRAGFSERALTGLREARSRAPDDVALLGVLSQILIERGDADARCATCNLGAHVMRAMRTSSDYIVWPCAAPAAKHPPLRDRRRRKHPSARLRRPVRRWRTSRPCGRSAGRRLIRQRFRSQARRSSQPQVVR